MYQQFFKRIVDFLVASLAFLLLSPVFILVTVLLFFANLGKPFFMQSRPGRNGKVFKVVKFKTMTDKKDAQGKLLPDADRLTTLGMLTRKTSLDEIPQLLNVIKGDMSLVGPRPLLIRYLPYYTQRESLRHLVRPGITGWAQVNGRNNLDWNSRLAADVFYVENISFALDLKIIWMTLKNILSSKDIQVLPSSTLLDLDEERKQSAVVTKDSKLSKNDCETIRSLLLSTYPRNIRPWTIYSDPNYADYLEKLISESPADYFFTLRSNGDILGFIHFKYIEDSFFLNNIVVNPKSHGRGFGKKLYQTAIDELSAVFKVSSLMLDAFESNVKAIAWYKRMGFKEVSRSFWYQLSPSAVMRTPSETILLTKGKDPNGFIGYYANGEKVASIINQSVLVFRDVNALSYLPEMGNFEKICLITNEKLNYNVLDCSIRMRMSL